MAARDRGIFRTRTQHLAEPNVVERVLARGQRCGSHPHTLGAHREGRGDVAAMADAAGRDDRGIAGNLDDLWHENLDAVGKAEDRVGYAQPFAQVFGKLPPFRS